MMKTKPFPAPDEWELIDDALAYWGERIDYSLDRTDQHLQLQCAGRTVRRRILRLRAKIRPLLPLAPAGSSS
jgi:hypothetical protein